MNQKSIDFYLTGLTEKLKYIIIRKALKMAVLGYVPFILLIL